MIAADTMAPTSKWMSDMNRTIEGFEQSDEDLLVFEVSDEALEAAASPRTGPVMSFPNAPTVNVLIVCCGNDVNAAPDAEPVRVATA